MNVLLTDCNDGVNNKDQDLDKDRLSKQKFVPVKTAPKERKRKGDNTEILTKAGCQSAKDGSRKRCK